MKFENEISHMNKMILPIVLLAAALVASPATTDKNKKKYKKQVVVIEQAGPKEEPAPVKITNPKQQLYGEWTVESIDRKSFSPQNRAYLYLDFNGEKLYGCNGCNTINGNFALQDSCMTFSDLIQGNELCSTPSEARAFMRTLGEARAYSVTALYHVQYLHLKDKRGQEVMTLRRQNLDFLNGPWLVKEMGGTNVLSKNLKLVIDVQMLTVNGLTKCNIINGVVRIGYRNGFDIQFEDLKSSHYQCDDIDTETQMLVNLEETTSCKKINDKEIALLDNGGTIVMVLQHADLGRKK